MSCLFKDIFWGDTCITNTSLYPIVELDLDVDQSYYEITLILLSQYSDLYSIFWSFLKTFSEVIHIEYITVSYWIRSWRWWKLITVGDNETFRTTDRHVNSRNDKYVHMLIFNYFLILHPPIRKQRREAPRESLFFSGIELFGALVFKRHNWNAQNEFWIFAPKIKHKKIRIFLAPKF